MNLLYFILITHGLTQILIHGKIFDKIRPNHYFFKCALCTGFHVGIFLFILTPYTMLFTLEYNVINAFLMGALSAGTSYILNVLFDDGGIKVSHE